MEIKIKKQNQDGIVRLETSGEMKEIMLNEGFDKQSYNLCFKGQNSSGIVTLTRAEAEELCNTLKKQGSLVKGFEVWK